MTQRMPTFREARPGELAATAGLRREMILEIDGVDYDALHPGWRERYLAFFSGNQASGRGQFFVAESGAAFVGTAAVYKLVNHRSQITLQQSAYICSVYVDPAWRRRGIARALTQACVAWAKANGCDVVRLRTSQMGRPVYEGLGFGRTDELELRLP